MSSLFSTSLISHLKLLRSFTRSHPLYFSFSIFFLPYLLSFLSPLSIAASLSLLALLALSPAVTIRDKFLAESDKVSARVSVSFDGESESESENELFDLGNFEEKESLMRFQEIRVGFMEEKSVDSAMEVKDAANNGKFEGFGAKADEFVGTRNGSKAAVGNHENVGGGNGTGTNAESRRTLEYNLGSHVYRRKEREWKRTLACKLYEERNESALKLSAGKMNSGIGRPNLMKISKAIKSFSFALISHVTDQFCQSLTYGHDWECVRGFHTILMGLHCLAIMLMEERIVNPDKYTDEGKPTPPEIKDPN
nr:Foldase protein like [Ipomoea batatas]